MPTGVILACCCDMSKLDILTCPDTFTVLASVCTHCDNLPSDAPAEWKLAVSGWGGAGSCCATVNGIYTIPYFGGCVWTKETTCGADTIETTVQIQDIGGTTNYRVFVGVLDGVTGDRDFVEYRISNMPTCHECTKVGHHTTIDSTYGCSGITNMVEVVPA